MSFLCRLQEEHPVSAAAQAAGVVRDAVLRRLGTAHHVRLLPQPFRVVGIATGKMQKNGAHEVRLLVTNRLELDAELLALAYRYRWAVEIALRDANAFAGLGQEQCRKRQRIIGANTLRLVLAAARTLWCIAHVDRGTERPRCRYRPWYRQKAAPSQLDVAEACREALHEAGIFPIPRFTPELAENAEEPEHALPLAA